MSDSTMLDITQINPVVRLKCYVDIIYYLTLIYSQNELYRRSLTLK